MLRMVSLEPKTLKIMSKVVNTVPLGSIHDVPTNFEPGRDGCIVITLCYSDVSYPSHLYFFDLAEMGECEQCFLFQN